MKAHRIIVFMAVALCAAEARGQISVHHINVGQADATLLELKTAAILIDAGASNTGDDRDRDHLIGYLDSFFQRRSDLNRTLYSLIVTHPHIDHTRSILSVFQNFKVRNLVDNGEKETGSGLSQLKAARKFVKDYNATHAKKIIYNQIDAADISSAGTSGYTTSWLRALGDSDSEVDIVFLNASRGCADENNDSLVVLVRYRKASLLVSGDAEWDEEHETCVPAIPRMLKRFGKSGLLDIDIYKVAHHGSLNGTNLSFLKAMTPEISVLPAGYHEDRDPSGNGYDAWSYGHPRERVVKDLQYWTSGTRPKKTVYAMNKAGTQGGKPVARDIEQAVYCSCWDGDIVISTNAAGTAFTVTTSE
jgi:competence protein ComEC